MTQATALRRWPIREAEPLHIRLETRNLSFRASWQGVCGYPPVWPRRMVKLLFAAQHLAWTQHPTIWLCEACAILWLILRAVRSLWVRTGVLLMLCGLLLNGVVTAANAGTMPVVGIPPTLHPASPIWRAATTATRFAFLADQAQLGLFSIGDLVMISGGVLIIVFCGLRTFRIRTYRTANHPGVPCSAKSSRRMALPS